MASYQGGCHAARFDSSSPPDVREVLDRVRQPSVLIPTRDVNARCIDDVPLTHWQIRSFDGRDWEHARLQ
jgi:hypothetical protein